MADRAEKFQLSELEKYYPIIDNMTVDVSDQLIDRLKADIENKILNGNIRLNTENCKIYFKVDIEYRKKSVVWKNNDRKFVFGRCLLYHKHIVDSSKQISRGTRTSVFCYGQVSEAEIYTSNGNIDYINDLCNKAGIPFTAQPSKDISDPVQPSEAVQPADRQERISKPTSASDVLPKTPKKKPADKAEAVTPIHTDVVETPAPDEPVIGTPFPSHNFNFVLYKLSEAYQRRERKSIIDNYLFEDSVSFFFGPSSSYKTFWLLWESIHIATGKELCGMKIEGGARKVLFITLEMSAKDISNRIHSMVSNWTAEEKKLLDENFLIISYEDEEKIRATSKNILDALMDVCDTNNIGGVYLDAYTEYIVGLDVRSESQGDVINAMRVKANKHHVFFRVIHHSTKTVKTKDGDIDGSMAGIHTIRDTADQVYAVKLLNDSLEIRITNDPTKDSSTKPRFGKAITFTVKFVSDEERGSFTFIRLQDNETSSYMDKFKQLLEIVEEDPGINSSDLKVKFGDNKLCRDVISNAIKNHTIIMVQEKSQRGSPTKKHYPPEYYNEHEVEILRRKA